MGRGRETNNILELVGTHIYAYKLMFLLVKSIARKPKGQALDATVDIYQYHCFHR
jgi:hypothetical protein